MSKYKDKTLARLVYKTVDSANNVSALEWMINSNPRPRMGYTSSAVYSKIVSYAFFLLMVMVLFLMVYYVFPHIS